MAKKKSIAKLEAALRARALAFPEATEDMPWGHSAFKVKGKTFCFMSNEDDSFGASLKLPMTGGKVLLLPFAESTGYGLGRAGWVSVRWSDGEEVPLDLLYAWLKESYRAVAPKKLAAALDESPKPALEQKAKPKKIPAKAPAKRAVKPKR